MNKNGTKRRQLSEAIVTPSADAIVPPAPKVHARDLPALRHLWQFSRNTLSTMPDYAFDVAISRRKIFGVEALLVNDPEGVRHVLASATQNFVRPVVAFRVFRPL